MLKRQDKTICLLSNFSISPEKKPTLGLDVINPEPDRAIIRSRNSFNGNEAASDDETQRQNMNATINDGFSGCASFILKASAFVVCGSATFPCLLPETSNAALTFPTVQVPSFTGSNVIMKQLPRGGEIYE